MDMSNKDLFRRFTYTVTKDRNEAKGDQPKQPKGRPFLLAIDKLRANLRVDAAEKGESNYD